jgi:hypothetical protein
MVYAPSQRRRHTHLHPGAHMKSNYEIKIRLTETIGEIRTLSNKDELFDGCLSAEEYEVLDAACAERDILKWVLD